MSDQEKPPKGLNSEDRAIWEEYTDETQEFEKEDFESLLEGGADEKIDSDKTSITHTVEAKSRFVDNAMSFEIDRRTEEKLRKGKMSIERKLDLHGMTQAVAHEALSKFIEQAISQKLRCVLIVTGKGKAKSTSENWLEEGQGVLKQRVPQWLEASVFSGDILRVIPAQPKDGGSGALYVYLRRKR